MSHLNVSRVTSILPHENFIWIGSGDGCLLIFEVEASKVQRKSSEKRPRRKKDGGLQLDKLQDKMEKLYQERLQEEGTASSDDGPIMFNSNVVNRSLSSSRSEESSSNTAATVEEAVNFKSPCSSADQEAQQHLDDEKLQTQVKSDSTGEVENTDNGPKEADVNSHNPKNVSGVLVEDASDTHEQNNINANGSNGNHTSTKDSSEVMDMTFSGVTVENNNVIQDETVSKMSKESKKKLMRQQKSNQTSSNDHQKEVENTCSVHDDVVNLERLVSEEDKECDVNIKQGNGHLAEQNGNMDHKISGKLAAGVEKGTLKSLNDLRSHNLANESENKKVTKENNDKLQDGIIHMLRKVHEKQTLPPVETFVTGQGTLMNKDAFVLSPINEDVQFDIEVQEINGEEAFLVNINNEIQNTPVFYPPILSPISEGLEHSSPSSPAEVVESKKASAKPQKLTVLKPVKNKTYTKGKSFHTPRVPGNTPEDSPTLKNAPEKLSVKDEKKSKLLKAKTHRRSRSPRHNSPKHSPAEALPGIPFSCALSLQAKMKVSDKPVRCLLKTW